MISSQFLHDEPSPGSTILNTDVVMFFKNTYDHDEQSFVISKSIYFEVPPSIFCIDVSIASETSISHGGIGAAFVRLLLLLFFFHIKIKIKNKHVSARIFNTPRVGADVGTVGPGVGLLLGASVGAADGVPVGPIDGVADGYVDGFGVVGDGDGNPVGGKVS